MLPRQSNVRLFILPLALAAAAASNCGGETAATEAPLCTAAGHCELNEAGEAQCEAGFTWAEPDNANSLTCVAVAAADAGAAPEAGPTATVAGPRPFQCGDGTCADPWESAANCAVDCAPWKPTCGDGSCDQGEACGDCPADCGPCAGQDAGSEGDCGDGYCAWNETCSGCPADCCVDAGGGGSSDSCVGKCGAYDADAKCQCDSSCQEYGDCCADYAQVCGP